MLLTCCMARFHFRPSSCEKRPNINQKGNQHFKHEAWQTWSSAWSDEAPTGDIAANLRYFKIVTVCYWPAVPADSTVIATEGNSPVFTEKITRKSSNLPNSLRFLPRWCCCSLPFWPSTDTWPRNPDTRFQPRWRHSDVDDAASSHDAWVLQFTEISWVYNVQETCMLWNSLLNVTAFIATRIIVPVTKVIYRNALP